MQISFHQVYNLPIVIVDDYYSESACEKIWQELCFLNNDQEKLTGPEFTGSALDSKTGAPLKKNVGIDLDSVYSDKAISNILKENKKLFDNEFVSQLTEKNIFFRYLRGEPACSTLIQYYENEDHYKKHTDGAIITAICYFYKKPKSFSGGNFTIEDKLQVECGYNRMIIFPSILFHSVDPVKVSPSLMGQNFGRYSITQFVGSPIGDTPI